MSSYILVFVALCSCLLVSLDGFRKVNQLDHGSLKAEQDDMEFQHPSFVQDKEHLLTMIKRKVRLATISKALRKFQ